MRNLSTESKRSPLTPASGRQPKFRYRVQNILLSERADWDPGEQAFLEMELDRLTENGEEIVSLLRDRDGDIEVILKVAVGGGV